MPLNRKPGKDNLFGKRRKQGESIMKVATAIIIDPSVSTQELSSTLNISVQTARAALRKVLTDPHTCAAKYGIDENKLLIATIIRNGIYSIKKKPVKTRKIVKYKGKFKKQLRKEWRGKANWPAGVAAKNRNISPMAAALWCGQEYDFISPGLYEFNENRAGRRPADMPKFLRTLDT